MSLFAKEPPILAVDTANLAHRAYHANKHLSTGPDKRPTGHVYGAVRMILPLVKKWTRGGKKPEIWWALEGRPTRRRKLYPEYKANRKRNYNPYPDVRRLILRMPGQAYYHPSLEADDLLSVMTHPELRGNRDIVLVTTDRDLWQMVGRPGVKVWCKDHVVNVAEMVATFGVSHQALSLVKALFGDVTDNIPPAFPGMRHNPLLTIINDHEICNPTKFREHLSELPVQTKERISENWKVLERNWGLVKLARRPTPKIRVAAGPSDPSRLIAYLESFQCKSLYDSVRELWP